jgi:molybdopterin converting factor small subunit
MKINVKLFYQLKQRAGTSSLEVDMPDKATIKDLRTWLEREYPSLRTHLDNVMVLMNKKIVLDEDELFDQAEVSFMTPVGGG